MIYRVGIYLRLSDEDRDKFNRDSESESIKNQRNLLIEEISKHDNFILVDEYCDEDMSGAGTYRPEFMRLIKDCESKKIDIVMVKSQSRFSRDMEIIEKYIHNKFIEWGIRFIGVSDNADSENMGNKKARQINGLVNEWYLEDVSNNIKSAFKAKMLNGEYISPFACYGYDIDLNDNNKLLIDIDVSYVVKKIFDLYLSGLGFMKIAMYLNNKNIPCPSLYKYQKGIKLNVVSSKKREDIKWSSASVKTILTNEIYIGNLIQGKRTTISYKNHKIRNKNKKEWIRCENTHEAIIDKDKFYKVQEMIKNKIRRCKKNCDIHIFAGKVKCLECGSGMRKKNSSKYEYLVCSRYNNGGFCKNRNSIRYDMLENLVLNKINEIIDDYFDIDIINKLDSMNNSYDIKVRELNDIKVKLNEKIEFNKKYLKNIYEDKINGIISFEQFIYLNNEYCNEIEMCKDKINELDKEIKLYDRCDKYLLDIDKFRKIKKLNRYIVMEFIDKIYVGMVNENSNIRDIRIEWNF